MKYHKNMLYSLTKIMPKHAVRLNTIICIHKHVTYYFRVKISVDFLVQGRKFPYDDQRWSQKSRRVWSTMTGALTRRIIWPYHQLGPCQGQCFAGSPEHCCP